MESLSIGRRGRKGAGKLLHRVEGEQGGPYLVHRVEGREESLSIGWRGRRKGAGKLAQGAGVQGRMCGQGRYRREEGGKCGGSRGERGEYGWNIPSRCNAYIAENSSIPGLWN